MLDRESFMREFVARIRGFSEQRESQPVRVVISTTAGREFDLQRLVAASAGVELYTREDQMVFLPYSSIEHVEVTIAQDRRVSGFEIPTEYEPSG